MSRILIIEDDEAIAELEKDYLKLNGHDIEISSDGLKGLELAVNSDFDLVIIDVMLPGMDGFDIVKSIREKKEIPLLLVSAKKDEIDKIRGLGLGADDYITKPFSPSELAARVSSHLARYSRIIQAGNQMNSAPTILKIRSLKIDREKMRVWNGDEEVKLTTKEYELLVLLAENPERVFSKEELFTQIWHAEAVGDINTVTVHVKRIREKIELNPQKPQYIETIWGVGYRFKV